MWTVLEFSAGPIQTERYKSSRYFLRVISFEQFPRPNRLFMCSDVCNFEKRLMDFLSINVSSWNVIWFEEQVAHSFVIENLIPFFTSYGFCVTEQYWKLLEGRSSMSKRSYLTAGLQAISSGWIIHDDQNGWSIQYSPFIPRLKLTLFHFPLHSQKILKPNLVTTYNNPAEDVCFVNEHWNWSETTIFDVWVPIRIFLSWTSYSLLARQVSLCSYFVLYSILSIRSTVTVLCSVGILLVYVADFVQVSEKCECSKCVEYAI